jgi:hypothetical protein
VGADGVLMTILWFVVFILAAFVVCDLVIMIRAKR